MNKILILISLWLISMTSFCQTDTIFSRSGKISCKVLRIKVDSILYLAAPAEQPKSIPKKEVDRIVYKNGKSISIKNDIGLKPVEGISNFNDVAITIVESEVKTYKKILDVQAKYYVSADPRQADKILDRSYRLLKIQAAMQGANIIYIPNFAVQTSDSSNTQLYGIAYSSNLPVVEEFEKLIEDKNDFKSTDQWYMHAGKTDVYQLYYSGIFRIDEITTENDIIYLQGELKSFPKVTSFRLISFTSKSFMLYFESGTIAYNVRVNL